MSVFLIQTASVTSGVVLGILILMAIATWMARNHQDPRV